MEYLAYGVLAVFYLSAVMPIIGSEMSHNDYLGYTDSLKIGAAIHIALIGFVAITGSVIWAFGYVTGY